MSLKRRVKHIILGTPGPRPRTIKHGLLRGMRFEVDIDNKSMRLVGLDERELTSAVRTFGLQARTAIDVGSNDGWYTLFFASLPNVETVLACEPDAAFQRQMRENLALNEPSWRGKVISVEKVIGTREQGDMRWCSIDALRSHLVPPIVFKIDVDGGEVDVLESARRTLTELTCMLVVETHSAELERECLALLNSLGYDTRVIDNGWYRVFVPELRTDSLGTRLPHNRWFIASRRACPK